MKRPVSSANRRRSSVRGWWRQHVTTHPFREGNILPLALVITTTILLAGIGLGMVVLDSLRRTAETDASMVAYYAADAGIERQVFELRKHAATTTYLGTLTAAYGNGSSWSGASSTYLQSTSKVFASVAKNDFQFVDLYDPDNIGASAGVSQVDWTWSAGADCGGPPGEVELGYAEWLSGGSVLPQNFTIVRGITPPMTQTLSTTKGYRLRFRARGCTASNLTIQVHDSGGAIMTFPGDISAGSIGVYKKSTQAITVQVPRQDILSGVFSFILFSECQLIKDPNNAAPACP